MKYVIWAAVLVLVAAGGYYLVQSWGTEKNVNEQSETEKTTERTNSTTESDSESGYPFWSGEDAPEKGVLSGRATIGPNCPVEQPGQPCVTPKEAYTSRSLIVYKIPDRVMVAKQNLSADGSYSFDLIPGTYELDLDGKGVDSADKLPQMFIIQGGKTITHDFEIDTGIR